MRLTWTGISIFAYLASALVYLGVYLSQREAVRDIVFAVVGDPTLESAIDATLLSFPVFYFARELWRLTRE